ncbi:hypothetical protein FPOAC2_06107 [Fusarium poae]
MFKIQDFTGMQYSRDGPVIGKHDYEYFNQQYASSSHQVDHDMNPALIVQPKEDTDTYKDMMVIDASGIPDDRALVYIGVSNRLQDFNAYLRHNDLFVPHGQCAYVCTGGHGQTGGYGQLGRSFGLFGDHIVSIRMVDNNGSIQEVTKKSDSELFYAILGGSPGNFGIITHYTIEVYRGASYMGTVAGPNNFKGPHGLKGLWLYEPKVLSRLLGTIAKMSDDGTAPRGYDLCCSVLSTEFPITMLFPSMQDDTIWQKVQNKIKNALSQEVLNLLNGSFPAVIVLYAQWCPTSKSDKYDASVDKWFQQFRDFQKDWKNHTLRIEEFDESMSSMTGKWIFPMSSGHTPPSHRHFRRMDGSMPLSNGWILSLIPSRNSETTSRIRKEKSTITASSPSRSNVSEVKTPVSSPTKTMAHRTAGETRPSCRPSTVSTTPVISTDNMRSTGRLRMTPS